MQGLGKVSAKRPKIMRKSDGKLVYACGIARISSEEAILLKNALEHKFLQGPGPSPPDSLGHYCELSNVELTLAQRDYLGGVFVDLSSTGGALSALLSDENLEEISVIGIGRNKPVHVFDSAFGWMETDLYFSSDDELKRIINSMAGAIGRRITAQNPRLNATLPEGSRLNACISPAAVSGTAITIRKFRETPWTPPMLARTGSVSFAQLAFLWMAIRADCSILVCGNTGSGKTTLLNGLLYFMPQNERIISVEETPELRVPHKHFVKLSTSETAGIEMQGLIVNTLRMRPDRVIVGEVRTKEEAGAFIDTLLAGQGKGCYATFHAQSASEAIKRLRNLGAMEQDIACIDLIITQKRWTSNLGKSAKEHRKVLEISEPDAKEGALGVEKIFCSGTAAGVEKISIKGKRCAQKIAASFGVKESRLEREINRRAIFLEKNAHLLQEEFLHATSFFE
ncbi:MAG: ATPase, T2SS/T4P/T4SS family [archaeon]|nr:ATPase, T2SS/T4P/T4SS family [archaeon]